MFDFRAIGQYCTHQGHRHFQSRCGIARTAHDVQHLTLADTDPAHPQTIRLRMGNGCEYLTHDHVLEIRCDRGNGPHFQAGHGQLFRQGLSAEVQRYPFTQPLFADFHVAFIFAGKLNIIVRLILLVI